jgi:hypothetical protein
MRRGGGGVVGEKNARARRVQRPDPAALEELVGGGEDRRGLPQLPAEPQREVERRGVPGGVARPGRAGRGAGEEVAVARQEGGSRAARCAWRHDDRHRHPHRPARPCLLPLLCSAASLWLLSFKKGWDFTLC